MKNIFKVNGITIKCETEDSPGYNSASAVARNKLFEKLVRCALGISDEPKTSPTPQLARVYGEGICYCVSHPEAEKKIQAIKIFREFTGFGLAASKSFVEGEPLHLSGYAAERLQDHGWVLARTNPSSTLDLA